MHMRCALSVVPIVMCAAPIESALSASLNIDGSPFASFPGAGTQGDENNIVGFGASGPSGLQDPTNDGALKGGGSVSTAFDCHSVDWYLNGAKSGYATTSTSGLLKKTESNENNNTAGSSNNPGWVQFGTTYSDSSLISFSVGDGYSTVSNGANNPANSNLPSRLLAYANQLFGVSGALIGWKLSLNATDGFVFAFDDTGSGDNDFDDFVGVGHVQTAPTPLGSAPVVRQRDGRSLFLPAMGVEEAARELSPKGACFYI